MSDYWTERALPILKALETPVDPQLAQWSGPGFVDS